MREYESFQICRFFIWQEGLRFIFTNSTKKQPPLEHSAPWLFLGKIVAKEVNYWWIEEMN